MTGVKSPLAALAADALLTRPARSRMTGHHRSEAVNNRGTSHSKCTCAYAGRHPSFDVGGVRDWLEDGVNGLLIRKGDTVGLAGAIEQLLRDRALRARLGSAARDRVTQRFGRTHNAARLLASYRELLN